MLFYPQISNAFAELGNMIATGIDNIADWFGSLGNKNTDIGTGKISILGRLHGNITFSRQRNEGRDTGLRDIPNDRLEDMARHEKGAYRNKLQKELKMRKLRNKQKKRGGPSMRGWWILFILGEYFRRSNNEH